MDLKTILPLLAKGNKDTEKIASLLSGSTNTEDILKSFISKDDPQTSAILSLLKNNANSYKRFYGLEPIKDIANDEIFGRLTKYFLSQKN